MAKEILVVPEDRLLEVIAIIRNGIKSTKIVSKDTKYNLLKWCDEEEMYMKGG